MKKKRRLKKKVKEILIYIFIILLGIISILLLCYRTEQIDQQERNIIQEKGEQ